MMRRTFVAVLAILVGMILMGQSAFAACDETQLAAGCVSTAIIGNGCSCGKDGAGIVSILKTVVEIMSVLVGILGVIGISVVGVQYLTAGGNEEQVRKSKRRMFEIVIGLAVYAVVSGILLWLLPSYDPKFMGESAGNTGNTSNNTGDSGNASNKQNNNNKEPASNKTNNSTTPATPIKNQFVKENNKTYYHDKNGENVTGARTIGGARYYFDDKGVMQTGFVVIGGKVYYYKEDGKKAYGTIQAKGKYNGTTQKDTWYLNSKTGEVEGVRLAVPRIPQSGYNCGPASLLMVRAYHVGKKDFTYNGRKYAWNNEPVWAEKCGTRSTGYKVCGREFGYSMGLIFSDDKQKLLNNLFRGLPLIAAIDISDFSIANHFTEGGGHYLVVSGYYKGTFYYTDPNGKSGPKKTQSDWESLAKATAGYHLFYPSK